jgi:hypothetical protein
VINNVVDVFQYLENVLPAKVKAEFIMTLLLPACVLKAIILILTSPIANVILFSYLNLLKNVIVNVFRVFSNPQNALNVEE